MFSNNSIFFLCRKNCLWNASGKWLSMAKFCMPFKSWGKEGSIWPESSNRQMGSHKCLEWSSHCRVNVLQSVFFVRHALPYLITSKGTIVPVSSLAGILCSNPIPIPPWKWGQQKVYLILFFFSSRNYRYAKNFRIFCKQECTTRWEQTLLCRSYHG